MTPAEADTRLAAAGRGARSYGDASFYSAVATADPGAVAAASEEADADALGREFLILAESMQELDVDAATIGDALDMVAAEAWVAECARRVKQAEGELLAAQNRLAEAIEQAEAASQEGQAAAQAAVAAAEDDVAAAAAALAAARAALAEALAAAADLADSMRAGLQRRHGGIAGAAADAPVPMAGTEFYGKGQ